MQPVDMGDHNRREVLKCLEAAGPEGLTTPLVCIRLSLSDRTVLEHIRALRRDKKVERKGNRWVRVA